MPAVPITECRRPGGPPPALARRRFLLFVVAILSALGLGACSGCAATSGSTPASVAETRLAVAASSDELPMDDAYRQVEVTTVGWDRLSSSPVVLLRELETGQIVPIWVGVAEARAIASALHEVEFPRPMTHDLMADLVGKLHGSIEELLIHDIVGGTYYGLLRLQVEGNGDEPVLIDTRPSDGMALALRSNAVIRVAQGILDETPDVDFSAPDEPDQVVRALGLTVVAPTDELRTEHAIPGDRDGLVVIRAVGHAAEAGLKRGDLLVSAAGHPVGAPADFLAAVRGLPFGEAVTVRYWRDGAEREIDIAPDLQLPETDDEGDSQVA